MIFFEESETNKKKPSKKDPIADGKLAELKASYAWREAEKHLRAPPEENHRTAIRTKHPMVKLIDPFGEELDRACLK